MAFWWRLCAVFAIKRYEGIKHKFQSYPKVLCTLQRSARRAVARAECDDHSTLQTTILRKISGAEQRQFFITHYQVSAKYLYALLTMHITATCTLFERARIAAY